MNSVVTTFLTLAELTTCDATEIVTCIKKVISGNNLRLNQLVGIGTDNASVMVGIHNGVYGKLKEDIPSLILIPCVYHSIQLAVSSAATEFLPRNLEFIISETFNWFSRSACRQQKYRELYKTLHKGLEPLNMVQLSQTRWLSIESCVQRIFNQWSELKLHFQTARVNDKCYSAELLYQNFNDDVNYAYICFLKPVLADVQRVNKIFESKNADQTKVLTDLLNLIKNLCYMITVRTPNFNFLKSSIRDNLLPKPYLGYLFENQLNDMKSRKKLDSNQECIIRNRCTEFIIKLIIELRNRLPHNIDILEKISVFSVENTLKVIKNPIIDILKEFYVNNEKIDHIQRQ